MKQIRFAFVGFDYFLSSVVTLCNEGWKLTDAVHHALKDAIEAAGWECKRADIFW
tara:strand:+ start:17 stop:181 length:165 start_codon:yes stop_codon:yes gene_type:complete